MSTAERIEKDYLDAYKAKDKVRLGTLRLLKTAAKNLQVELMRPLTDADYMDVLLKQAKQGRIPSSSMLQQTARISRNRKLPNSPCYGSTSLSPSLKRSCSTWWKRP